MLCPKCGLENPTGNNFCGKCGASLDPIAPTVKAYLDENLKTQVESVFSGKYGWGESVEIALAAKVSDKLMGWAKLLGFFIGIPTAIAAGIIGFYGWHLQDSQKAAQSQVDALKADLAAKKADLDKDLDARKTDLANVANEIAPLQQKIRDSTEQLAALPALAKALPALNQKVDNLGEKVTTIEERGVGPGPQVSKNSENEGKALGIDVSHFNSQLDWVKFKAAGVSFAFIKASQGISFTDPAFQDNWQRAKSAGMLRGAYHFLTHDDPAAQAISFAQTLHREPGDLPPVIDFEESNSGSTATLDDLASFAKQIDQDTGCTPIIVSGTYFKQLVGVGAAASEDLGRYPLWIIQYGPTPVVPPPWKSWTFWQFTNGLSVNGLPPVQFNVFNGSAAALQSFAKKSCKSG